jgi:hypothetical protein
MRPGTDNVGTTSHLELDSGANDSSINKNAKLQ